MALSGTWSKLRIRNMTYIRYVCMIASEYNDFSLQYRSYVTSRSHHTHHSKMVANFLDGQLAPKPVEDWGNNRFVMPLDVLGLMPPTLSKSASMPYTKRCGESCETLSCWGLMLKFLIINEEFLVSASQQLALIMSLPFVHTACRYYRLNDLVRSSDRSYPTQQWMRCILGGCSNLII